MDHCSCKIWLYAGTSGVSHNTRPEFEGSNKVLSADNQQERPRKEVSMKYLPEKIGYYLAGFADGEGSFNISFRRRADYKSLWKVSLCFNISQKDKVILSLFKRHIKCGTMRQRQDGIWYYEVNNINAIKTNVIPFFKKFRFLSAKKKRDFSKFCQITEIVNNNEHLTKEGIKKILEIRRKMNDGGKRKYSEEDILENVESSETIRQTALKADDIVRSSEQSEVNINERS